MDDQQVPEPWCKRHVRFPSSKRSCDISEIGRNAAYLLTCSQLPFLHITQAHVARDCTAYQGLGPPISIGDLQNTSQTGPQASLIWAILLSSPLPR